MTTKCPACGTPSLEANHYELWCYDCSFTMTSAEHPDQFQAIRAQLQTDRNNLADTLGLDENLPGDEYQDRLTAIVRANRDEIMNIMRLEE